MTPVVQRLLISARDPGAAHNIAVVADAAIADCRFNPTVIGDNAGYDILSAAGLPVIRAEIGNIEPECASGVTKALKRAVDIIDRFQPDAILTGLSGPDIGIDEMLLEAAGKTPTYSLQDFWGHVNCSVSARADVYFVADDEAALISRRLHGVRAEVAGSPKYALYEKFDPSLAAARARASLAEEGGRPLACVFGQALSTITPGPYQNTVVEFFQSVAENFDLPILLYRPHPREDDKGIEETLARVRIAGLEVRNVRQLDTESWLSACDVMATCYSNCGYDLAFLNRYSDRPLGVLINLNYEKDIRNFYRQVANFDTIPVSELSLTLEATSSLDIGRCVRAAQTPETRETIWRRAKSILPDPQRSAERILDRIADGGIKSANNGSTRQIA